VDQKSQVQIPPVGCFTGKVFPLPLHPLGDQPLVEEVAFTFLL